jgi:hypothetical protein
MKKEFSEYTMTLAHTLKEIVKNSDAVLSHVCEGKVYYEIVVYTTEKPSAVYQLEIDSTDDEWKATYLYPKFKAITLMRWIRKGFENGKLIQIK